MSDAGLKAIFLARRDLIERLVRARVHTPDDAQDVMQELWLRIAGLKPGPINDPAAYLMRMALNLAADRSLSSRRRASREDAWVSLQPGSSEFPNQETRLAASDELERVQACLDRMPGNMARALIMFRLEGQSQRAIAADLGMSISGVEKLLARAYRQLAELNRGSPSSSGSPTVTPLTRNSSDAR